MEHVVRPALCLDWDGTIRRSKSGKPFIENFRDIELMPGIEKIIHRYRQLGYIIIGISNQGGVAHGYKTTMEIELERDATLELFKDNPFHIVKMCYHMEDGKVEPYNHRSLLRKPNIGMLALAELDAWKNGYVIDWDISIFVGDRPEDVACAENAKIKYIDINDFLNSPHQIEVPGRVKVNVGSSTVGAQLPGLVGELTDQKILIFLKAVSDVPTQENISGVELEDGRVIGSSMGNVVDWETFKGLTIKVGNITL